MVRNIGKGAAKHISFEFSAPLEIPDGDPVSDLPHFTRGIDYLAPGAEIRAMWDSMITLGPFLEGRSLQDGITITSRYRSIGGESYESEWTINPLLLMGTAATNDSMRDLVRALMAMQKDLHKVVGTRSDGLKVSTATERQKKATAQRQALEEQYGARERVIDGE